MPAGSKSFIDDKDVQIAIIQATAQIVAAVKPNPEWTGLNTFIVNTMNSLCKGLEAGVAAAETSD
jgi:hypothetical protein